MSLYRRGRTWHCSFTIDGERFRASTHETDKARATKAARRLEAEARDRAKLGPPREEPTLEEVADRWFAARVVGRKSELDTFRRLKTALRLVGPDTPIKAIGAREIAAAMAARRVESTRQTATWKTPRAPSPATVNRDLIDTTLRPIHAFAENVLEVEVRKIAWADLRLREPPDRERVFTAAELAAWLEHLPVWHHPVHDFIKRYGVRMKEAFFHPSAFDPETGRIRLRKRKNGRDHIIRLLPEDARAMAARAGRALAAELDTVWFKEDLQPNGDLLLAPIHWRAFQAASRAALDGAKIVDARPVHDLRHHAATMVMRGTGNLAAVKKMLGHEALASTMRYAHADDDDVLTALSHTYGTEAPETSKSAVKTKGASGT